MTDKYTGPFQQTSSTIRFAFLERKETMKLNRTILVTTFGFLMPTIAAGCATTINVMLVMLWFGCGASSVKDVDTDSPSDRDTEHSFEWTFATPESVGMDGERLNSAIDFIESQSIDVRSMIVVKNGHIVLEHYFAEDTKDTLYNIESSTKSILSVLFGIAVDEGLIQNGIDAKVVDFFGDKSFENPSDEKSAMTVQDLLTMQSGLDYDNSLESFLGETDSLTFILNHDMRAAPGTEWSYSSADTQLLSAILSKSSGKSLLEYGEEKLFSKLGMNIGEWTKDAGGIYVGGFGLKLTARDMARFGLFMLRGGVWNGEQIVPESWIDESLKVRAKTNWSRGDFGYLWWIRRDEGFSAAGRYGQQINFFPDRDLVVVYTGALPLESSDDILDRITKPFVLCTEEPSSIDAGDADGGDVSSCDETAAKWTATDDLASHVLGVLSYTDGVSTACVHSLSAREVCLEGRAADAETDYSKWGAGLEFRLAAADEDGNATAPFDAVSVGIGGVRFTVAGVDTGLRAGVTEIDQDDLPYQYNPFIIQGDWSGDITSDGTVSFQFDELSQPSWSDLPTGTIIDPTKLYGLRVQVVTKPLNPYNYDFCVRDITWLDNIGEPIAE
jgi:CubicO group peptidase (beta-lactamase class C family)